MKLIEPFYALTDRLVFSKIRATIGIRDCVVSGGGSLAKGLDDFFEIIGLEVQLPFLCLLCMHLFLQCNGGSGEGLPQCK